jgi:hypothetical protein
MKLENAFDASAWVGNWPFVSSVKTDLVGLVVQQERAGFSGAAISPMAAILGPEPMAANRALLEQARQYAGQFTVGIVPILDPSLPGWRQDLTILLSEYPELVAAIKIVPNYHGYAVDSNESIYLAEAVAETGLGLCVQVRMLDERAHHPLMIVPGVPVADVVRLASATPSSRILTCGVFRNELSILAAAPNISVELSSVESGNTLEDASGELDADRLMLGTHAPIYYPLPGMVKLTVSGQPGDVVAQIATTNAAAFFGGGTTTN